MREFKNKAADLKKKKDYLLLPVHLLLRVTVLYYSRLVQLVTTSTRRGRCALVV